jgi:hypothetical protein
MGGPYWNAFQKKELWDGRIEIYLRKEIMGGPYWNMFQKKELWETCTETYFRKRSYGRPVLKRISDEGIM